MQPLLNIAVAAARQAGDILLRYHEQIDRIKITPKGAHDYFTDVDVKSEQAIIHAIHKAYPDHGIIAEESGVHREDAECVWIIDPLDGTANYIHGFPFYAVSLGVRIKDRMEHAVVYDPLRHECFSASRGRGARLNDRRLRVSKQTQLSGSLLAATCSSHNMTRAEDYLRVSQALLAQGASLRRTGSLALDLAYVASGRLDGLVSFGAPIWDMAAGSLLVQEAGGLMSDRQGGEDFLQKGESMAGTPKIFKALFQACDTAHS